MTRTAYLRVYQPLTALAGREEEVDAWLSEDEDKSREAGASRRWLIGAAFPSIEPLPGPIEGAFVRKIEDETYVCPWRTRLRMLAGLLAFRQSVPDEVAEAFVSEDEAHQAARELSQLERDHPEIRSHILHANWHVPLRWFVGFDDAERILTEDKHGLRVRYEASLNDARSRLRRAIKILESSWIDDSVVGAVRELAGWLGEFEEDGLLELDYGSVAAIFPDDELVEDRSAAAVWSCLASLERGDVIRAGRIFTELTERWTEVRAREVVN
ncbi:MAG TPA: hypothetical protein VFS18_01650 [Actinomycetota bacterium]|nr:hypothetical protein [Actinomycetota bacterium]